MNLGDLELSILRFDIFEFISFCITVVSILVEILINMITHIAC